MSDKELYALALRMHRERLGITQAEAAGLIRFLNLRTWQAWESARTSPPDWAKQAILDMLAKMPAPKQ